MRNIKVLFVDDDKSLHKLFTRAMAEEPYAIETADDGIKALETMEKFDADLVVTDVMMPGMDGLTFTRRLIEKYPCIFILVVTGYGTIREAVEAIKIGAYDYLEKPFDFNRVKEAISKIFRHKLVIEENMEFGRIARNGHRFENIIGRDPKMYDIFQRIVQVAETDATVCVTGETGTGKELVAEKIHFKSARRDKPLVRVNCSAFTETLINSELFGHEKGAFTGATALKKGFFEQAQDGTIFLDEIGDIPMATQIALLRTLEAGIFQRVGGTKDILPNARVVCATNRNLLDDVEKGTFRKDLYYRLNVVDIRLPPLRERKSDIPLLAQHFLNHFATKTGKPIQTLSKETSDALVAYDWPGNVRELSNAIENAIIFSKTKNVIPEDLPIPIRKLREKKDCCLRLSSFSLAEAERKIIRTVLEEVDWNLKRAAEKLEISRGTLYSKMKKFEIERS